MALAPERVQRRYAQMELTSEAYRKKEISKGCSHAEFAAYGVQADAAETFILDNLYAVDWIRIGVSTKDRALDIQGLQHAIDSRKGLLRDILIFFNSDSHCHYHLQYDYCNRVGDVVI